MPKSSPTSCCICLKSIMLCHCRPRYCSPAAPVQNIRKVRAKKYFTEHCTAKIFKLDIAVKGIFSGPFFF